jgi:hypothetical protein
MLYMLMHLKGNNSSRRVPATAMGNTAAYVVAMDLNLQHHCLGHPPQQSLVPGSHP